MRCWYRARRTTARGGGPERVPPPWVQPSMADRSASVVRVRAGASAAGSVGIGAVGAGSVDAGWAPGAGEVALAAGVVGVGVGATEPVARADAVRGAMGPHAAASAISV